MKRYITATKMNEKKGEVRYPKGWDAARVKALVEYYENQTEDEALREYLTAPVYKRKISVKKLKKRKCALAVMRNRHVSH